MMDLRQMLPCAWDAFDVYLFDIDGTLINCTDATHYFAFSHALRLLSGRDLTIEGVTAHGNVDVGILRDALRRAGIQEEQWRPRIHEAQQAMGNYVADHRHELRTTVLPSVPELLQHLKHNGATLGVATGNLASIGQMKLEHAGLWSYFDFAGWSDQHETRTQVFHGALQTARSLRGASASICVVGDTPADIAAAHANGLPVIAVATGVYSMDALREREPEMLLPSFLELLQASVPGPADDLPTR